MNKTVSETGTKKMFAISFILVGLSIFMGVLISFKTAGGVFAQGASLVGNLSLEGISFLGSLKKAIFLDALYCLSVLIFAAAFPISFLPGVFLIFKGFCLGAAAGLAAKTLVTAEAAQIFFAVFISNFLVLPLKILLYLSSVGFSLRTCPCQPMEKTREYARFVVKIIVFFSMMCLLECFQLGVGTLVLS